MKTFVGGARCCLVCHLSIPNGCAWLVFRTERSRGGGYMMGGAGIVVASSAQWRRVVTGVEHGDMGLGRGSTRGRGGKTAAGVLSDVLVAVKDTGGGEMACLWGVWGEQSGINGWAGE